MYNTTATVTVSVLDDGKNFFSLFWSMPVKALIGETFGWLSRDGHV